MMSAAVLTTITVIGVFVSTSKSSPVPEQSSYATAVKDRATISERFLYYRQQISASTLFSSASDKGAVLALLQTVEDVYETIERRSSQNNEEKLWHWAHTFAGSTHQLFQTGLKLLALPGTGRTGDRGGLFGYLLASAAYGTALNGYVHIALNEYIKAIFTALERLRALASIPTKAQEALAFNAQLFKIIGLQKTYWIPSLQVANSLLTVVKADELKEKIMDSFGDELDILEDCLFDLKH